MLSDELFFGFLLSVRLQKMVYKRGRTIPERVMMESRLLHIVFYSAESESKKSHKTPRFLLKMCNGQNIFLSKSTFLKIS